MRVIMLVFLRFRATTSTSFAPSDITFVPIYVPHAECYRVLRLFERSLCLDGLICCKGHRYNERASSCFGECPHQCFTPPRSPAQFMYSNVDCASQRLKMTWMASWITVGVHVRRSVTGICAVPVWMASASYLRIHRWHVKQVP